MQPLRLSCCGVVTGQDSVDRDTTLFPVRGGLTLTALVICDLRFLRRLVLHDGVASLCSSTPRHPPVWSRQPSYSAAYKVLSIKDANLVLISARSHLVMNIRDCRAGVNLMHSCTSSGNLPELSVTGPTAFRLNLNPVRFGAEATSAPTADTKPRPARTHAQETK